MNIGASVRVRGETRTGICTGIFTRNLNIRIQMADGFESSWPQESVEVLLDPIAEVARLQAELDLAARADARGIAAAWEQSNNNLTMYQDSQREIEKLQQQIEKLVLPDEDSSYWDAIAPEDDWVIKSGLYYLCAPHWCLWDQDIGQACRFDHAGAMKWLGDYAWSEGDEMSDVPVAVYSPEKS